MDTQNTHLDKTAALSTQNTYFLNVLLSHLSYNVASGSGITPFIIYKVMKYRKILIKYNAYFKKAVFHSRENIKSCIFTAVKI